MKHCSSSMLARSMLAVGAACICINSSAAPTEDAASVYGGDDVMTLATGYRIPIRRAPATATVVTRHDLDVFGARTLKDALNLVPGFHIATADARSTFSTVRGITSRVLILIDGIPVARTMVDPWVGFDNFLLYNVDRIEVVRGPGSAIYGADAVAGVINIQTKTSAHSEEKREFGAQFGSNQTKDAWTVLANKFGAVDVSAFAAYSSTDEDGRTVEADSQTILDQALRTHASKAPGEVGLEHKALDVKLDVKAGDFTGRFSYLDQDPLQNGVGVAYALDPTGSWNSRLAIGQLNYNTAINDAWQVDAFVDYSEVEQNAYANIFPAGAFRNAFPQGVISDFTLQNDRFRAEATALYSGFDSHVVRVGGGWLDNRFENKRDVRNFIVKGGLFIPTGQLAPYGGVNDAGLIGDADSETVFAYVQDEWRFATDWSVTTGVRWDRYSDFGSTTNPRVGLVWNAQHNITVKALYGRSFRPPSILELQSSGIFSARGNPDLEPTTLDMAELGFAWDAGIVDTDLTVFRYRQGDLIQVVAAPSSPNGTQYVNDGSNKGWGFEATATLHATDHIRSSLSYAYQDRIGDDADNNAQIRFAPHHLITWTVDAEVLPEFTVGVSARAVMDRERAASDPRANPDDYVLVNLAARRNRLFGRLDLMMSINNVLDKDIRDPSPSATTLPFDIPMPGRVWYAGASLHW